MPISSAEQRAAAAHLRITELSAGYGAVPVIRDVSMTVSPGEVVAVVGPNGAGKSTLLKAVIGILPPMSGQVTLDGTLIGGLPTDRIARLGMGYVPQNKDVFEPLTVHENLEVGGYMLPSRAVHSRIDEIYALYPALAQMRTRHAGNLSGGERKMLAMGRVMMSRPKLLVLDEPTAGLSPQMAAELLTVHVTRLAEQGVAILLVEQRTRDALQISDWAYVLASGAVLLEDAASRLLARPDLGEVLLGQATSAAGHRQSPEVV